MAAIDLMLFRPASAQLELRIAEGDETAIIRGMFVTTTLDMVKERAGEEAAEEAAKVLRKTPRMMAKASLREFNELRLTALPHLLGLNGSEGEALASIGTQAVDAFFDSVAGRTMKLLSGSDPHRLMSAAPQAYELVIFDGGHRTYEKTGPCSATFRFKGDWIGPCHHYGVFKAAIRQTCGVEVEIDIEQETLTDFELHVHWSET